jgi:menaquinone-dependent protoporphyrinogen oxidase
VFGLTAVWQIINKWVPQSARRCHLSFQSMAKILLLYSTTDGHTLAICRRLAEVIEGHGHDVALVPVADADTLGLDEFDKIIIGASIRYGRHSSLVLDFVRRNRRLLDARPSGFFSVSVVARKPGRNTPDTNPYLRKFLRQTKWRPRYLAVFAGRIDYPRYGPLDRMIIRLIMWITRGPTDPASTVDFTDWHAVESFGHRIAAADDGSARR